MKLPTFSGKSTEWETYKGMFLALVHNVPTIPPILKLQYLLGSLSGEAANRLRNVPVTAENYNGAWKAILDKYDHKKVILSKHMHNAISCAPASKRSIVEINRILDVMRETNQAFENLAIPKEKMGDLWLVYLAVQRLDPFTREEWEKEVDEADDYLLFSNLTEFLEKQVRILERAKPEDSTRKANSANGVTETKPAKPSKPTHSHAAVTENKATKKNSRICSLCKGQHFITLCDQYKSLDVKKRLEFISNNNHCTNCLKRNHSAVDCRASGRCYLCQEKHHTTLHGSEPACKPNSDSPAAEQTKSEESHRAAVAVATQLPSVNSVSAVVSSQVLLATAIVELRNPRGVAVKVRALLNQGAEMSFLAERVVNMLDLKTTAVNVPIVGIGKASPGASTALALVLLSSPINPEFVVPMEALVFKTLTSELPTMSVQSTQWDHIQGLQLADYAFGVPSRVDCIVGADLYGQILLGGLRKGTDNQPVAQETVFGWVLSGKVQPPSAIARRQAVTVSHVASYDHLRDALKAFWKVEEPPMPIITSPEEDTCEALFNKTHRYDEENKRFFVSLPFKTVPPDLGDSRSIAVACWIRQERKLEKDPQLKELYHAFMREYLALGHMELVEEEDTPAHSYYIPHHGILKQKGKETSIRVVFNASQKSTNGKSLNEQLYSGSNLQELLWSIILLWRFYFVAVIADIIKMFRQIGVNSPDSYYQLIVWRERPNLPLRTYRLLTVTYGTTPAPYLSMRVLLALATRYQSHYPKAAEVVRSKRYMDDFLFGADTVEEALQIQQELIHLLSEASMGLSKWASNIPELLPESGPSEPIRLEVDKENVSSLGLTWNPKQDVFRFNIKPIRETNRLTKRIILSETSKLFDPLGWLGPVVIRAKVMLQDLWLDQIGWDEAVPSHIEENWTRLRNELRDLELLQIPRFIGRTSTSKLELHGFSDASERAYAACIFVVVRTGSTASSSLIIAKTKVAPVQTLSMPRLELCGAHLLARLMSEVSSSLSKHFEFTEFCWTDSQIVLHWLSNHPSKWKTFVATRVTAILSLLPQVRWRHVKSAENPANIATRGAAPRALKESSLWWNGPAFILESNIMESHAPPLQDAEVPELRPTHRFGGHVVAEEHDFSLRFSSYQRLLRTTARILRLAHYMKTKPKPTFLSYLTAADLRRARDALIKIVQAQHYQGEIHALQQDKPIKTSSPLQSLRPFLDDDGLLRVGGRLANSSLPFSEKHPFILPKDAHLTKLIARQAHEDTLHGAQQLTLSYLTRTFWIVHGRTLINTVIKNCVRCARFSSKPSPPIMGELPRARVTVSRPFLRSGVDYAGPFNVRVSKGRGQKSYKGYLCIFVCLVTRALHIEVVSDYSSIAFIAAFKRFVSRRGQCEELWSDNAKTFRGADAELKRMLHDASRNESIAEQLENDGTRWKFIPPDSPHFGGIWESAVKSTKHHLRRVIGDSTLTYEELSTFVIEVEACLNSRPLYALSSDPQDLSALTPGHFLVGSSLKTVPEPESDTVARLSKISRWFLLSKMKASFWTSWQRDYLRALQQRPKWRSAQENLKIDDLVLICNEDLPPTKWLMGRICAVYPGKDGGVRVVKVRTATNFLVRPVSKVCKLPVYTEYHSP